MEQRTFDIPSRRHDAVEQLGVEMKEVLGSVGSRDDLERESERKDTRFYMSIESNHEERKRRKIVA